MNRSTRESHEYTVQGITCSHCVMSGENVDAEAVRGAVVKVGYEVAA